MKDNHWPLQDAKNHFSEMVNDALIEGPQWVTRRGQEAVVVLDAKQYKKLIAPKESLWDVLQRSPHKDVDLDPKRSDEPPRQVDL